MKILQLLLGILKTVLPFLRTAAEKAFNKLPKEKQQQLIQVSKMVEIIKQMKDSSQEEVISKIITTIGIDRGEVFNALFAYYEQKGIMFSTVNVFQPIWDDATKRTETGLKSLWSGISNIVSSTVAEIDWELLLMGVGEFVYRSFVKGKIKI